MALFALVVLLANTLRDVSVEFDARLRHQAYHLNVNRLLLLRTIQQIGRLHREDRLPEQDAPPAPTAPDASAPHSYTY